ncbi:MAG: lipid-A-disaccharide synthase, partial [Magnetococcales bacterium]|nr:lipid-A-disaccharide synthase [Magnetococcales bacterium]
MTKIMPKIMIIAGEASGDLLGADLLTQLRLRVPDLTVLGVGGPRLQAAGLPPSPFDIHDLAIIGLAEVVRRLPRLWQIHHYLTQQLKQHHPDLLLTIDLPDFNLLLARRACRLGVPAIHYVSPQIWAWRTGRIRTMARLYRHLLTLFPFEPPLFAGSGLPVTFVGHPLVQRATPSRDRQAMRRQLGFAINEPLVALLPGSRMSELQRLLPPMLQTAQQLRQQTPPVQAALALAEGVSREQLLSCCDGNWPKEIPVCHHDTYNLLHAADVALVASGTATLECALIGTPMVVVYRVHPLTYAIGRRLIRVP